MQILEPTGQLVQAAESAAAEDALLDVCRACHSLCHSARLADLLGSLGEDHIAQFLAAMAQLTQECIDRGGISVDNAAEWQGQATGTHPPRALRRTACSVAGGTVCMPRTVE